MFSLSNILGKFKQELWVIDVTIPRGTLHVHVKPKIQTEVMTWKIQGQMRVVFKINSEDKVLKIFNCTVSGVGFYRTCRSHKICEILFKTKCKIPKKGPASRSLLIIYFFNRLFIRTCSTNQLFLFTCRSVIPQ